MFPWEPDLDLAGGGFLNEVKTAGADEGERVLQEGGISCVKDKHLSKGALCRGQRNEKSTAWG